jgi:Ran GTPase-activating protein (RanGAP) involved in mRNA processing and transport
MEALAKVIRYNKTLQVLWVNNNMFGPVGMDAFTNALYANRTITAYYAAANAIGDEAGARFARVLAHNPQMKSVSLAHTGVGDETVRVIAECGRHLTLLDVSHNKISNNGGVTLQQLVQTACFVQDNPMSDSLIWYDGFWEDRETDV